MAAYAALVSAARTLDECCNDINNVPDGVLGHGKEELEKIFKSLLQSFNSLEAFLGDFPEEAEKLEGRIRDVAQEADDLIEDFMLKLQQQIDSVSPELKSPEAPHPTCWGFMCDRITGCTHPRVKVSRDFPKLTRSDKKALSLELQKINEEALSTSLVLQKVNEEALSIEDEVLMIKNTINTEIPDLRISIDYTSSKLAPHIIQMVGFDDQLLAIKEWLCGHSTKLTVIPISGMGGIGKTTLARNAFDDRLIEEKFDLRAWTTVSQTYSVREILVSLLVSCKVLNDKTSADKSVEWLKEGLYKSLKGRRYLIVLDDVWSTEAWDEVRRAFPDDHNGSRVLLTTRLSEVAEYAAGGGGGSDLLIHSMEFLDANQSWKLLQEKVFSSSCCPHELEDIGMDIARRCGGLPLTIVVTAGILQTVSPTQAAWKEIARKVNAESSRDERVANVLALSYRHLPHHLRPCFLYMAAFPEDYKIDASVLSRIWTAEGFLKRRPPISATGSSSSCNIKSFEETTAEEYLEDLVRRSLVMVGERDTGGKIVSCSLHDLLRDMCIEKAEEENFLQRVDADRTYGGESRRLSIDYLNKDLYNIIMRDHRTTIRTILSFQETDFTSASYFGYNSLLSLAATRLLRAFHAPYIFFNDFSSAAVLHLFHLRYLQFQDFSDHRMSALPEDIYKLRKLQTLISTHASGKLPFKDRPILERVYKLRKLQTLISTDAYVKLPFNIWRMPKLRHIQVYRLCLPAYDAETTTFTTLENLQTLSRVNNLVWSESITKSMPNIKQLELYYSSKFQVENLVHLHRLETLDLEVAPFGIESIASSSMEKLALPTTLRKLSWDNCMLTWEKFGSIASSLPNLQELLLRENACCGEVWETKEGQFPRLKMLFLEQLNLRQWITEGCHFPSLENLRLSGCSMLLEIPDGIADIPTLQLIQIWDASNDDSIVESAKSIECQQRDMGNDELRIRIY